jgi:hypothetical protein
MAESELRQTAALWHIAAGLSSLYSSRPVIFKKKETRISFFSSGRHIAMFPGNADVGPCWSDARGSDAAKRFRALCGPFRHKRTGIPSLSVLTGQVKRSEIGSQLSVSEFSISAL